MKVQFTKNEIKIINLLGNSTTFSSVETMAKEVKVSQRSIYKHLKSINEKLEILGIEGTRNVYGHGYYFSDPTKTAITEFINRMDCNNKPIFKIARENGAKYQYLFSDIG